MRHKKTDLSTWNHGSRPIKMALSPTPELPKSTPSKKPKNHCIKFKGPHVYPVGILHRFKWGDGGEWRWVTGKCMGCGKKLHWDISD